MADKLGLKAALDTTKQFISLATGILTVTVTFAEKFKPADASLEVPVALKIAWIAYVAVVLFGMATLITVTDTYHRIDKGQEGYATDASVLFPALGMVLAFLVGVVATVAAAWTVVR